MQNVELGCRLLNKGKVDDVGKHKHMWRKHKHKYTWNKWKKKHKHMRKEELGCWLLRGKWTKETNTNTCGRNANTNTCEGNTNTRGTN